MIQECTHALRKVRSPVDGTQHVLGDLTGAKCGDGLALTMAVNDAHHRYTAFLVRMLGAVVGVRSLGDLQRLSRLHDGTEGVPSVPPLWDFAAINRNDVELSPPAPLQLLRTKSFEGKEKTGHVTHDTKLVQSPKLSFCSATHPPSPFGSDTKLVHPFR